MSAPETSGRLVATLAVAGLLSGAAVVGAYELTLPTITENKAAALRRAVLQVVPGAESMEALDFDGQAVYGARDGGGRLLGYAVPAEGPGFQDTIKLIYGYDPARRRVVGMRVLESRETPGLGDKIFKDQDFVGAFDDLAVDPQIVLAKAGEGDEAFEVDAITGATISSRAVVGIINRAHEQWGPRLEGERP